MAPKQTLCYQCSWYKENRANLCTICGYDPQQDPHNTHFIPKEDQGHVSPPQEVKEIDWFKINKECS